MRRGRTGALCAALLVSTAACGTPGPRPDADPDPIVEKRAPAVTRVAGRRVGPLEFRDYTGAVVGDARLPGRIDALAALVTPTADLAEERAGVSFIDGRGALVDLVDDGVGPSGEVTTRLLDGVRRPLIRIPARRLVSGEFVAGAHFPPLVVEAAVLAVAGERIAPSWLRSGLATEIGGSFERILHERVLGGPSVRTQANALFPQTPAGDDPLVAAVRVRALARIARGERALARFVSLRLTGSATADALRDVGVHDAAFLDAAAETERDRALESVQPTGTLRLLADARSALAADEASRGVPIAGLLERQLEEGDASPFVASDARVVAAAYRLRAGDAPSARAHLVAALTDPVLLVRLRHARLLEARTAAEMGETGIAVRLYRGYAADYPGAEGADEALRAVGIDPGLGARLPGIADELVSDDPEARRRAALRLGETGDAAAAKPLRQLAGDDDPDVRRVALSGLSLVLGTGASAELELATFDPVADVRAAALAGLAFVDAARGEMRAQAMVDDESPEVRTVVDRLLAPVREKEQADAEAREAERRAAEAELVRQREEAERERARENDDTGKEPAPVPDARKGEPLPPPKPPRPLPAPDDPKRSDSEGGGSGG